MKCIQRIDGNKPIINTFLFRYFLLSMSLSIILKIVRREWIQLESTADVMDMDLWQEKDEEFNFVPLTSFYWLKHVSLSLSSPVQFMTIHRDSKTTPNPSPFPPFDGR